MTTVTKPKPRVAKAPIPKDDPSIWQISAHKPNVLANIPSRITFDPANKAHRTAFAHFMVCNKWPDGVRFESEWPHTSAVTTIQTKLTLYALRNEIPAVKATTEALQRASTQEKA